MIANSAIIYIADSPCKPSKGLSSLAALANSRVCITGITSIIDVFCYDMHSISMIAISRYSDLVYRGLYLCGISAIGVDVWPVCMV